MPYYAPIENLFLEEDTYTFNSYIEVKKNPYDLDTIHRRGFLSSYETSNLKDISHWLVIDENHPDFFPTSSLLNLFLISLWIVGPHNLKVDIYFKNYNMVNIFHDQFHYNPFEKLISVSNDILAKAKMYFKKGERIYKQKKRLHTALLNTFYGCVNISYKVSAMCYAAALESLLTYSREPRGLSYRLAKSYACLTEDKQHKRNAAYRKFRKLYKFRSDLVHGRKPIRRNSHTPFKKHSEFSFLLRKVWKTILENDSKMGVLEKPDYYRKKFFQKIERGYTPPKFP